MKSLSNKRIVETDNVKIQDIDVFVRMERNANELPKHITAVVNKVDLGLSVTLDLDTDKFNVNINQVTNTETIVDFVLEIQTEIRELATTLRAEISA